MTNVFLFGALGLGEGALIASLALAVVVFYRGSGVINLSTGAIAMVAGYLFYVFSNGNLGFSLAWEPALALTLVCVAVLGTAVEVLVFWPLRDSSPLAKLAASLGLMLVAQTVFGLVFGSSSLSPVSILPGGVVHVFGAVVPTSRFLLAGGVVVLAALLAAVYRFTPFGLATRASAESEANAMTAGLSSQRLSLANALLASVVAGLFGVLVAPLIQLDTTTLPLEIVPALGAALLAGFTSLGVACTAGLALGIAGSLVNYAATQSWFPTSQGNPLNGLEELLFFVVVVLALFLRGGRMPGRGDLVEKRLPMAPRPERLLRPAVLAAVIGVVALIVLPFDFRQSLVNSMLGALICLSLVVIVGYVGQISLVQLALAGVTGFAMSHLLQDVGGAWAQFPLAPLIGIAAALAVGLISGFAALRVRGVSLAVATLAGVVAIEQFGYGNPSWGAQDSGSPIAPLHLWGLNPSPTSSFRGLDGHLPSPVFGFVVLAIVIGLCALVSAVRRHSLGQRMLAVRSNERAAAAAGIDVRRTKLTAFVISSLIAGVAGVLYAYNFGTVDPTQFGSANALVVLAFAYFGGITMVTGALLAGLGASQGLLPHALDQWFGLSGNWAVLIGAIGLILTLLTNPDGLAGTAYRKRRRRQRATTRSPDAEATPGARSLSAAAR
jgi:branched-chain amino acid transport system permease protein